MKQLSMFTGFIFRVTVLGALLSSPAMAGSKVFLGGSAVTQNGVVEKNAHGNVDPFLIQIFSGGNECLIIKGLGQTADMKATLTAPTGRTWQDDNSGGALLPRISAVAPIRGWYTLQVTTTNPAIMAPSEYLTLDLRRVPRSHSTCSPVTPPAIL